MGFQSKGAVVEVRCVGSDQFAEAGGKWGFFAHDALGEFGEVLRDVLAESKHVPDLGVFFALHGLDQRGERAGLWVVFDAGEEHGLHGHGENLLVVGGVGQ